jgi:hypothetical protein
LSQIADISSLAKTLSQMSADQLYVQSVNDIRSFVGWIQSVSTPAAGPDSPNSPGAVNAFAQMKTDSSTWINTIYPQSLELPTNFVAADSQITPALNTLSSLAQQLIAQPDSQTLHAAIVQAATALSATVSGLQTQVTGLVGALGSSAQELGQDSNAVGNALAGLQQDMNNEAYSMNQLQGQLNYLEHQNCPNQNDINACLEDIQQGQQALNQIQQLAGLLNQASSMAFQAATGLNYMAGYWSALQADAQSMIDALAKVAQDAPAVLTLDLQFAAQSWARTLANAQQIVTQSSAS